LSQSGLTEFVQWTYDNVEGNHRFVNLKSEMYFAQDLQGKAEAYEISDANFKNELELHGLENMLYYLLDERLSGYPDFTKEALRFIEKVQGELPRTETEQDTIERLLNLRDIHKAALAYESYRENLE
jgi:hypothetical protein